MKIPFFNRYQSWKARSTWKNPTPNPDPTASPSPSPNPSPNPDPSPSLLAQSLAEPGGLLVALLHLLVVPAAERRFARLRCRQPPTQLLGLLAPQRPADYPPLLRRRALQRRRRGH